MSRLYLSLLLPILALLSVGCCGPMGCGPGCGIPTCNDCDGANYGERIIPQRPLDGLRQLRKNMVCGSGCGEVYVGEWISTPPDCEDPCCDDQFVGGAVKARFGCWQPGMLMRNFYGARLCTDAESSAPCGCGVADCGGDCGTMGSVVPMTTHSTHGSDCGCASHSPTPAGGQIVQRSVPRSDAMTRSARQTMATAGRLQR